MWAIWLFPGGEDLRSVCLLHSFWGQGSLGGGWACYSQPSRVPLENMFRETSMCVWLPLQGTRPRFQRSFLSRHCFLNRTAALRANC